MLAPSRRRRHLAFLALITTILTLLYLTTKWTPPPNLTAPNTTRRITKVSALYGARNTLYERALQSHRRHAERWGYGMRVLADDILESGYWSKPAYLLSLVLAELARPPSEDRARVEWFMWVDADSIVLNPAIPLEIFLPPADLSDEVHMVATRDHNGLNTGIFFLHVHAWTVTMLVETLAYPLYNAGVDLGVQADQSAMERVLNNTKLHRGGATYLPRPWINAYEWAHAFEGGRGSFLVHFPGLGEKRWAHMERWLDVVERVPGGWEVPVEETWYLREGEEFWGRVRDAHRAVNEYEREKAGSSTSTDKQRERAVRELKRVLYEAPFEGELLQQRIDDCNVVSSFVVGNLPSFLVILALVYFLTQFYRIRKNPLSSLPGPEISKWTDLVLKYHTVRGERPRYVHALHEKYGPIVRVSPGEVDISDPQTARAIHRIASPFLKAPWYRLLNRKDGESIFSTTDPEYHRRHRRLLSAPLSDANLRAVMQPLVRDRIALAIDKIRAEAHSPQGGGVADVYKWFFFMATDIIGELSFGDSFRMLELGKKNQYIEDLETVAKIGGIRATFPVTMSVASVLPLSVFREVVESTDRILEYAMQSVDRYKAHLARNPGETKQTLFTRLYSASQLGSQMNGAKSDDEECLSDREIRNDAQSFIVAGSDTTANTLTYLVWSVLRDSKIQETLIAELDGLAATELSDEDLRELPYLNQVISEALRLYPAVPSALPRAVPDKGATLAGYWLPGGATVTTQLYSLHRDPDIFEDPERASLTISRLRWHPPGAHGAPPRDGLLLPRVSEGEDLNEGGHERSRYGDEKRQHASPHKHLFPNSFQYPSE
ncbi:cytochrome P450 [Aspergillus lucknowensis]|uniref:Cytochrome P450 n=1 Tax=Aspergillus lucknowensis TaxID=176173 RepID=A0ABR4L9L9_9EURO